MRLALFLRSEAIRGIAGCRFDDANFRTGVSGVATPALSPNAQGCAQDSVELEGMEREKNVPPDEEDGSGDSEPI